MSNKTRLLAFGVAAVVMIGSNVLLGTGAQAGFCYADPNCEGNPHRNFDMSKEECRDSPRGMSWSNLSPGDPKFTCTVRRFNDKPVRNEPEDKDGRH